MATKTSPGRIGLTQIHGKVGLGIRVGQYLNGSGFEDFEHAFVDLGDGTIIEAEPGGARIRSIDEYVPSEVHWCDGIYAGVSPDVRLAIAEAARGFEGTRYSFLDYDALVLHRLGLDATWLERYISDNGHMICSQLADSAYVKAGYRIFPLTRWEGFVTPGDLYKADIESARHMTRMWPTLRDYNPDDLGTYPI
jgi:hypothetical protein